MFKKLFLALEHPLSVILSLYAVIILALAGNHIYVRWNEKPRHPSFWACLGIMCHWFATGNSRFAKILQDGRKINLETQHIMQVVSFLFAFAAAVFYSRFLSQYINDILWRWVAIALTIIGMILYSVEVLL